MLVDSGLSKNVLDNMKKGSMPSVDKVAKIADFLEVSVDFLLGRTPIPEVNRPETEKAPEDNIRSIIVKQVNGLSDHQAQLLLAYLEGMLSE